MVPVAANIWRITSNKYIGYYFSLLCCVL